MLALAAWQALLDAMGWILARIYDLVGNYGLSIIILTFLIRLVLLPLGIKQIKSMGAMQAIQPKVKEIQKKYKGNKQKAQEETMKLYKDAGVNPLGGCLPLLLQFPILIAMYSVIRAPVPNAAYDKVNPSPNVPAFLSNHFPTDSALYAAVTTNENTNFLLLNLQCSASQAGKPADVPDSEGKPSGQTLDCGSSTADKIPYYVLLALMVGTAFYQQRQMQQASPPGAASSQQQAILKVMPLTFGIFGFAFPAGLTLYWTVSNIWQIGQQYALLKAGHIGPEAMERHLADRRARNAEKPRGSFISRLQERAERTRKDQQSGSPGRSGSSGGKPGGATGRPKGQQPRRRRPNTGGPRAPREGNPPPKKRPGSGGSGDKGNGEPGS